MYKRLGERGGKESELRFLGEALNFLQGKVHHALGEDLKLEHLL